MGTRSCGPLRSHMPAFLNFSFAFLRSCSTFFSHSPVLSRSCFALLCSCIKECMCGGMGVRLITRALCVYGNSPPRHYPSLSCVRGVRVHILAGSRFGVKLISRPQSPPSTSPLSTRHSCVISSQERKFSVFILPRSRIQAFPRSCIKFAFLRALVPGTRESGKSK